jgi:RHS repeat-associated protein
VRYLPFGEVRSGDLEALPTDHGFTGHKHEAAELGLIFMEARFYVPGLGRFLSADILVPNPADPQSYNRYAYVLNNPLGFSDPTGHCAQDDDACWAVADQLYEQYGWLIEGVWTIDEVRLFVQAADAIAEWFLRNGGGDAAGRVRSVFGGTTFAHADFIGTEILPLFNEGKHRHHVRGRTVYLLDSFSLETIVHELGHVLDNRTGFQIPIGSAFWGGRGAADDMARLLGARPFFCPLRCVCSAYQTPNEAPPSLYARKGPSEDFAESFRQSVLNPTGFHSNHPIRAGYLDELASSLTTEESEFVAGPLNRRKVPAPVPTPPGQ